MNKKSLLILTLTPFLLISCGPKEERKREDSPEDVTPVEPTEKTASTLNDDELKDFPSYFLRKLSSFNTYKAVTSGSTIASMMGIKLADQSIEVTVLRDDYSYLINESHSSIVNTVHKAYFHEKMALYTDSEEFNKSTLEEYLNIYGTYPFDSAIEGYSISEKAVKGVSRLENKDGNYSFKVEFDKDEATNNVKIQMKKFGSLDEYPSFVDNTIMEITVKDDFTPVSLHLTSHYKAKRMLETDCKQDYNVTYSLLNEAVQVPNKEEIINKFAN